MSLLFIGLILAVAPALVSTPEQHESWGVQWHFGSADLAISLLGAACIALGIGISNADSGGRPVAVELSVDVDRLVRASNFLFGLVLVGYATWLVSAVTHGLTPDIAYSALMGESGASYRARAVLVTVPGLSTLTEMAPSLAVCLVILWRCGRRRAVMVSAVLTLSILRAFLNSERLSLITVVVPVVAVALLVNVSRGGSESFVRGGNRWAKAVYLLAPMLMLLLFAITERGRSWSSHYASRTEGGLMWFAYDRILGYYATAANNGAILRDSGSLGGWPLSTQFLSDAPGFGHLFSIYTPAEYHAWWVALLSTTGNPEFNNPSGIVPIFVELGPMAVILWALWGVLAGGLYRSCRRASVAGIVGYCSLCVGLVELGRIPYFTSGRFVVNVLAIVIVYLVYRGRAANRRGLEPGGSHYLAMRAQ
ncbi:hypothetical protein [Nocardioides sp. YIM 152588]|uniref:hypothetical protein n=1 Tax=Nocardioides sp. YIM 152588 TaxID=3158259 RepID=UPI0032E41D68